MVSICVRANSASTRAPRRHGGALESQVAVDEPLRIGEDERRRSPRQPSPRRASRVPARGARPTAGATPRDRATRATPRRRSPTVTPSPSDVRVARDLGVTLERRVVDLAATRFDAGPLDAESHAVKAQRRARGPARARSRARGRRRRRDRRGDRARSSADNRSTG